MEKGIVEGEGTDKDCLGEWSTPGEILIPPRFVNTFFYAYNAKLMTELAEVLGRSAEAFVIIKPSKTKERRSYYSCEE